MLIFEEPFMAIPIGLVLAAIFFAVQLQLCFRGKNTAVQRIPVYLLAAYGLFVLLIALGLFGEGSGFLGNVNGIVAAILGIVGGIAAIGILAAWAVYKRRLRRRG